MIALAAPPLCMYCSDEIARMPYWAWLSTRAANLRFFDTLLDNLRVFDALLFALVSKGHH